MTLGHTILDLKWLMTVKVNYMEGRKSRMTDLYNVNNNRKGASSKRDNTTLAE